MNEAETTTAKPGEEPSSPKARSVSERPRLGQSVGTAAGLLGSEALSNGDRAALRRISPDAPFTPALWKVLHRLEQHNAPDWISQERWERRWATLLMGMAFCVSPSSNLHEYDKPFGEALFEAGWSELRFVRLLRSKNEALEVELRRVAQYLASKSQPANWADVAYLLFYQSGDASEDIRLSMARAYYGAKHRSEQQDE
jgi:CRISPR system Cascade subunit CasB